MTTEWLIEGLIPAGAAVTITDLEDPEPKELLARGFDVVICLHGRGAMLDGPVKLSCHWRPGLVPGQEPPEPYWVVRRDHGFERVDAPQNARPTLKQLRQIVLDELDDEWRSPTELGARLGIGAGASWYRLCLTLERLAADGLAELQRPGATVRRFRARREAA